MTTAPVRAERSAASRTRNPRTESSGSTGRSPTPADRVPEQLVEPPVVTTLGRDRSHGTVAREDPAPPTGRLVTEPGVVGAQAIEELDLLRVEVLLDVLAAEPPDPQPRTGPRRDQRCPQPRADPVRVIDRDERRILDAAAGTASIHLREHPAGRSEQQQALIHEMRAEIAMRPAGLVGLLAPLLADRAPPLEAGLEAVDRAESPLVEQCSDGLEVAVPAPVLVDGQDPARAFGRLDQRLGLRHVHRDRLVDHDVPPGVERADADRDVGPVRRRDDDHLDLAGVEQLVDRADDPGPRMLGGGARLATRVGRRDRGQPQPIHPVDVRGMEQSPGQPVADHADTDRARCCHRSRLAGEVGRGDLAEPLGNAPGSRLVIAHAQPERRQVRVEHADPDAHGARQQGVGHGQHPAPIGRPHPARSTNSRTGSPCR